MTQLMRLLVGALLTMLLVACGGGGGSPGTTNDGGTHGAGKPTLVLDIVDSTGAVTTTVASTTTLYARAVAKNGNGATMSGEVINFTADSSLVRFAPASATGLTDAGGVAMVQIAPASGTAAGAGSLKASATLAGTAVTAETTFQVPAGTSDSQTSKVADFVMLLDKSTLSNAGTATAALTVITVDANNNVVPGAKVQVSSNANTVFTPSGTVTDASGRFTGTLMNSSDKSDRTVTISTTVNNIKKQTTLQISGSEISLTTTPSVLTPSQPATITARLTDAVKAAIPGTMLTFGGDIPAVAGRNVATDSNGNVVINFTAPSTAASYIVSATGSGVKGQLSVQVGSGTAIPDAVIPGSVSPSLEALPNVVTANTEGSTSNQTQIRFLMIDANNVPVPNVRVRFDIISTGLGSFDSTISSGKSTVYTNAGGVATATFTPGTTGSPTNGVTVRACYQASAFGSDTQCAKSVNVNLTVTAQALAVSIGDDNLLQRGDGTYIKKFVVTVADAAGRAVADAPVDISVDITHYGKGKFSQPTTFPLSVSSDRTYVPDAETSPADFNARVSCINEDKNRNGMVDPGENVNGSKDSFGQETIEPRKSDIIISYAAPAVKKTGPNGVLLIQVEYSQRFATWLAYRVRASSSVAGSQGSAERMFITSFIEGDERNGSFLTPPYGFLACNKPD